MEAVFVIVGGGIAGVSCAETLACLEPNKQIILITESPVVKAIVNLKMLTKTLSSFDVIERDMNDFSQNNPMITVIQDSLVKINSQSHTILTKNNKTVKYQYLCLCMGGKPKVIPQGENSQYVLGIRDTDSVETLVKKIGSSKRMALIGNGGIATELIHKVKNIEVDWIIKDKHITATFVDPGAAEFFQSSLNSTSPESNDQQKIYKTYMRFKEENNPGSGAALGPDWYNNFKITGVNTTPKSVKVHYQSEITDIKYNQPGSDCEYPVEIHLTNGELLHCDLIISATGVSPRTNISTDAELTLSPLDHGIKINDHMETSLPDVFAAGDVCTPEWPLAQHWFPMRLWTQARQMGCFAAKCMIAKLNNEDLMQDFCFELFAHSTNLFGYKVVLLGLYNGQKLGSDYECLIRMTPKMEFIKFVIKDSRLQGAILIGDTDLAETCENLILNQLDLSPYGDDILNPDIDIEDYFD